MANTDGSIALQAGTRDPLPPAILSLEAGYGAGMEHCYTLRYDQAQCCAGDPTESFELPQAVACCTSGVSHLSFVDARIPGPLLTLAT